MSLNASMELPTYMRSQQTCIFMLIVRTSAVLKPLEQHGYPNTCLPVCLINFNSFCQILILCYKYASLNIFTKSVSPFKVVGELMGCMQSWEISTRTPLLPGFILLGSFSGTFLLVSILAMLHDCHSQPVLHS